MIFITKKAFENEIERRMGEIHFKTRTDEELWKLKDEVRELQHKVEMLEQARNTVPVINSPTVSSPNVYEPAPYWTNPNWKAPDFTCTNTPQMQCDTPIRDIMTGKTTCAVPQMDIVKDAVET